MTYTAKCRCGEAVQADLDYVKLQLRWKKQFAFGRHVRDPFAFVIRCLPTLARLHLRTARDNRFPRPA